MGYRQLDNSKSKNIQQVVDSHKSIIEILRDRYTALPEHVIRDSRTLLLFWMLTSSNIRSSTFWGIIRRLFCNDFLFMLRRVFLLKIKTLIVTRVFRIGYVPLGPDRPLYLESFEVFFVSEIQIHCRTHRQAFWLALKSLATSRGMCPAHVTLTLEACE